MPRRLKVAFLVFLAYRGPKKTIPQYPAANSVLCAALALFAVQRCVAVPKRACADHGKLWPALLLVLGHLPTQRDDLNGQPVCCRRGGIEASLCALRACLSSFRSGWNGWNGTRLFVVVRSIPTVCVHVEFQATEQPTGIENNPTDFRGGTAQMDSNTGLL